MESVCYMEKCIVPNAVRREYTIVALYKPPEGTKFSVQDLWIRGSGPGLTWDMPIKMNKTDSFVWEANFKYITDPLAATCTRSEHCSFLQSAVEFRLYRDKHGSKDMLGPNFHHRLPISFSTRYPQLNRITVYPWFFNNKLYPYSYFAKHTLGRSSFSRAKERFTLVYYPPSFNENTLKRYPLVVLPTDYMLDLLYIVIFLEHVMVVEGSLEEVIIVVEGYGSDLSPYQAPVYRCLDPQNCEGKCMTCLDPDRLEPCEPHRFRQQLKQCAQTINGGYGADDYLLYLEVDLLPRLMKVAKGRILFKSPQNRLTILGYRYSGLFACYAGLTRPDLFQNVGCLSAAFYLGVEKYYPMHEFKAYIEEVGNRSKADPHKMALFGTQKYYIDIGEQDDYYLPFYNARESAEEVVNSLQDQLKLRVNKNLYFNIFSNYSAYKGTYKTGYPTIYPFIQRLFYPLMVFHRPDGGGGVEHVKSVKVAQSHFVDWEMFFSDHFSKAPSTTTNPAGIANGNLQNEASRNSSIPPEEACSSIAISMPVYIGTLSAAVVVSSLTTGLLFCLREANKNVDKQDENVDPEDLVDIDSDSNSDSTE